MEEFCVRPAYGKPDLPLIEFRGMHRAPEFPPVLRLLSSQLPSFRSVGGLPALDDFLWNCEYTGGSFELSDDWGGLFIIPLEQPAEVARDVAAALERTGYFKRVPWWAA
jgi:hypothetical protein